METPIECPRPVDWKVDNMKALNLTLVSALLAGICMAQGTPKSAEDYRALSPEARDGKLKPGDPAMDFTLKVRHSQKIVTLSSYKGRRPVALIFGSYT